MNKNLVLGLGAVGFAVGVILYIIGQGPTLADTRIGFTIYEGFLRGVNVAILGLLIGIVISYSTRDKK